MFTGYSITSDHLSSGNCVPTSGSSVPIEPPFTATINASHPNPAFYSVAGSSLVEHIGFVECVLVAPDEFSTTPADLRTTARPLTAINTGALANTSTTGPVIPTIPPSSTASAPKKSFNITADIGMGLGSVFLVVIIAFYIWKLLQYRKPKLNGRRQDADTPSDENRPYLQQKGELEADEKRKYELQAEDRRYELADDNQIREMSTTDSPYEMSTQRTQELRGEEHSRELGHVAD